MPERPQSLANHRAWPHPAFMAASLIYFTAIGVTAWAAIHAPAPASITGALAAVAVLVTHYWTRRNALIVQDRIVRLEMRLRLERLLPGDAWRRLSLPQLIALRFAGDGELPGLVERTLRGDIATPRDIKRAISDWQADWQRV